MQSDSIGIEVKIRFDLPSLVDIDLILCVAYIKPHTV